MSKIFSLIFITILSCWASDGKKDASASMPHYESVRPWIPCVGTTIINGQEIFCRVCGNPPNRIRVVRTGEIEGYCAEHRSSSAFYSRK